MAKRRIISQEVIDQQDEVVKEVRCFLLSTEQNAILQYRGQKVFMKVFPSSRPMSPKRESEFNEQNPKWIKSMIDLKLLVILE